MRSKPPRMNAPETRTSLELHRVTAPWGADGNFRETGGRHVGIWNDGVRPVWNMRSKPPRMNAPETRTPLESHRVTAPWGADGNFRETGDRLRGTTVCGRMMRSERLRMRRPSGREGWRDRL